ncbi:MAG: S66 peptidase family protein [Alkaliphilus sp.]
MNKPKVLKKGDCVGFIAPSSPASKEKVEVSKREVEKLGFKVKVGKSCYANHGYLSGCDDIRARDLNNMFYDKEIDAIMCIRGGYGTIRILDKIDYKFIKNNPKIFVGYSDITALHIALTQKCNLVTFHGAMPSTDMVPNFDEFAKKSLFRYVTDGDSDGKVQNPSGVKIEKYNGGVSEGAITGGNLSVIASTIGTPYEIDTREKILFLEDIDERPYRIDRMLMQLSLAGKLSEATGFVLGDWNNCIKEQGKASLSLMEVFKELIVSIGKPVIYNLRAGHCKQMLTLPLGLRVRLDANKGELHYLESATS